MEAQTHRRKYSTPILYRLEKTLLHPKGSDVLASGGRILLGILPFIITGYVAIRINSLIKLTRTMATRADLDAALQQLVTTVNGVAGRVDRRLESLKQVIPEEYGPEVQIIQDEIQALNRIAADVPTDSGSPDAGGILPSEEGAAVVVLGNIPETGASSTGGGESSGAEQELPFGGSTDEPDIFDIGRNTQTENT